MNKKKIYMALGKEIETSGSNKPFFQFKKLDESTTEIDIYGDITSWRWMESDVSASTFKEQLNAVDTPNIDVHINSYGGEVAEGLAIYNMLKDSGKNVTTINDGFACSIASIIFMAGTKRVMNTGSLLLWHNPWTYATGNANELRKTADDMEKMGQSSVDIYLSGSNLDAETIKGMMDIETWINADEAIGWGIATSKHEEAAKQSMEARTLYATISRLKSLEQKLNEKPLEKPETNKATSAWDEFWR